eukprot:5062819-Prymnesium_polylepis.1
MQKWPGMHGPVHSRVVCPGAPPYLPAAHNSGSDAPNSHAWPIGQSSHSSAAARLSEPENRPAAHGIEAALPSGHCVGQMNLTQLMSAGPQDWPESIPACPHVGSPRTRLWARRRCRAQATRRAWYVNASQSGRIVGSRGATRVAAPWPRALRPRLIFGPDTPDQAGAANPTEAQRDTCGAGNGGERADANAMVGPKRGLCVQHHALVVSDLHAYGKSASCAPASSCDEIPFWMNSQRPGGAGSV